MIALSRRAVKQGGGPVGSDWPGTQHFAWLRRLGRDRWDDFEDSFCFNCTTPPFCSLGPSWE